MVARVYLDSVLTAYQGIASEEYLSSKNLEDCLKQWSKNIHDVTSSVVVAEENNEIVGLASFGRARDDDLDETATGEIHAIYVAPRLWGNGVGRQLCQHVLGTLNSSGNTAVVLWVLDSNVAAIGFYERIGFSRDSKSKTVNMGRELRAVRFRRGR